MICKLYGDSYDDREEDSAPGGLDWIPGKKAQHKSLYAFRKELAEVHGIELSNSKILKILITGGLWTTERTREVGYLYEFYTEKKENGGKGLEKKQAVAMIAEELEISPTMVYMSLSYGRTVYDLEDKSSNARRCDRAREKRLTLSNSEVICGVPNQRRGITMVLADVNNQEQARLFFNEFHIPYEVTSRGENKGRLRVKPIRAVDRRNLQETRQRLSSEGLGFIIDHANCFRDEDDNTVCTFSPYQAFSSPVGWVKMSEYSIYGMGTMTFAVVVENQTWG